MFNRSQRLYLLHSNVNYLHLHFHLLIVYIYVYSRVTDHPSGLSLPWATWPQAHTRMHAMHVHNTGSAGPARVDGVMTLQSEADNEEVELDASLLDSVGPGAATADGPSKARSPATAVARSRVCHGGAAGLAAVAGTALHTEKYHTYGACPPAAVEVDVPLTPESRHRRDRHTAPALIRPSVQTSNPRLQCPDASNPKHSAIPRPQSLPTRWPRPGLRQGPCRRPQRRRGKPRYAYYSPDPCSVYVTTPSSSCYFVGSPLSVHACGIACCRVTRSSVFSIYARTACHAGMAACIWHSC